MANADVSKTLDECVAEVLGLLTGLDLRYRPEEDRYQVITRFLNQAVRRTALDADWSYYRSTEVIGTAKEGKQSVVLRSSIRLATNGDDAAMLTDDDDPKVWAPILPRDALHKYRWDDRLFCATQQGRLLFSRPFTAGEAGLKIEIPVMREPKQFRLPEQPEDPAAEAVEVPFEVREQLLDFDYPDLVIARAAYMYSLTDPVAQPQAQTLEQDYKTLMYQLIERDEKRTEMPEQNAWNLPITSSIYGHSPYGHNRPFAGRRR